MSEESPRRVVSTSMIGMEMSDIDRWSDRVIVVLGQNPGAFTGPGTNTYIVGTGARRVLIDTGQGVERYIDLLEQAIAETEGLEALDALVITHAHPDHIGGVEQIRARFGDLPVRKIPRPEYDGGVDVEAIEDGCVIEVEGATLDGIWTPGHASDHLCFYLREEKAVFTGDVVLGAGTTVIPRDGSLGDYLASLERLLELDLERIYPAHGPMIDAPHEKIREYIAHRQLRTDQIADGLRSGVDRIEDLVKRIYVDVPEFLHPAAGVSVEAHLRHMCETGVVEEQPEGRWALL